VSSDIEVFIEHHRGPDPSNLDQLCSQLATDALVSCHHFLMFCTVVLSLTCISVIFVRINMAKKTASVADEEDDRRYDDRMDGMLDVIRPKLQTNSKDPPTPKV
jgi:hypothetical protein